MGKKLAVNEKALAARQQKASQQEAKKAAAKKKADDDYWEQHDNPKNKRDKKREEEEKKRLEAAQKREEKKRLQQEEEATMARLGKSKQSSKVTAHQLHLQAEKEKEKRQAMLEERERGMTKTTTAEEYGQQVDVKINNREAVVLDAHSLDDAVKQMSLSEEQEDRHPEKYEYMLVCLLCCIQLDLKSKVIITICPDLRRAKAAFAAYFERELPIMKEKKPGLKLQQYKSRIFEQWCAFPWYLSVKNHLEIELF